MSERNKSRVKAWSPPARPEWVQRINEEGHCLDLKAVVPLDEDSLIAHAKRNTGLSDFGADDWYEPFKVFIKALDEEADLNLMGRLMTRSDILMNLEGRLRVEDEYKRHPEINDLELSPPAMIVGSGRSGTSAILNLLSMDPDNSILRTWHALFPCPAPGSGPGEARRLIDLADKRICQWNRVTPEIMSMHEFSGEIPTELIHAECLSFQSNGWLDLYGFVPTFDAYLAARGFLNAMSYAKRTLKLLQWRDPRKRWMLKSPDCMRYLGDLFTVFPDIQLVWMHRDPIKCVSSMVSLVGTLFWIRSDQPLSEQAIAQLTNPAGLAAFFGNVMDQMDKGQVAAGRFHHVQYLDFVADPIKTVDNVYRDLGFPLTPAARRTMSDYVENHPREARPPHRYTSGDSAQQSAERKLFERYQTRFGVKSES
jgi:hypothetical protein